MSLGRGQVGQGVGFLVVPLEDVVEPKSIEPFFKLQDFFAVGLHFLISVDGLFHHFVDDQLGVPSDEETASPKVGYHLDAVEEHHVFCNIVSGSDVKLESIPQHVTAREYEEYSRPNPSDHEGAIEVHGPILKFGRGGGGLLFRLLRHKVSEYLGLDGSVRGVGDVEAHEFEAPSGNVARRLVIVDDISKANGGHHDDWVAIEVMPKLALGDKHDIEELLDLWVAGLGIREDLANEVHQPLHHEDKACFLEFHYA